MSSTACSITGADLAIERHHTNGGGVSDHVFALCHLLGFRFAPRIPNIAARRLHLFDDMRPGPDIAPLMALPIDEALIADHWTDVIRLATSIRTGVTSASVMLERLGSYPRANGLALALREIGRVERTLFTLDWIERPEERRQATRELNKARRRTRSSARSSSIAPAASVTTACRPRGTAPARSIWSLAQSYYGTPPISKPLCATLIGRAARCRLTCSSISRRSDGSTST